MKKRNHRIVYALTLVAVPVLGLLFWPRHAPAPRPGAAASPAAFTPPPHPVVLPSDEEMARAGVNEAGLVPILEYHEIGAAPRYDSATKRMYRSEERFRHDLERLYDDGYRPITMREYLDNRIDLPLGRSPFIFTFDDARASQLRYRADGSIDPNCAVGILQAFHQAHPDFPLKATFFVLPNSEKGNAFGISAEDGVRKMRALQAMGFELENHTLHHRYFNRMADAAIAREIALGQAGIQNAVPQARIDVLALPGGYLPRSHSHTLLLAGESDGIHYANRAILMAGADPAPAPISRRYKAWHIPRILAVEESSGITYWLDYLEHNKSRRYVSDGVADTVSVPAAHAGDVDSSRLQGAQLHLYGAKPLTPPATKSMVRRHHKRRQSQVSEAG
jgi:peptidoglycan/xylan/chitin deacetylase (PgdA/CDA1 family)